MKVKLNSADGSTSFQVRDKNDVVVSSITSDGNIHTKYGVRAATGVFTATGATAYSITTSSGLNIQAGSLVANSNDKLAVLLGTTTITGNLTVNGIINGGLSAGNIISTGTYVSPWTNSTVDNTYEDIAGVSVTFTMSGAGTIFAFFTCNYKDADGGFINYEFMLDNTTEFGIAGDDGDTTKVKSITCIGMIPASAGSHTVKVRRKGDTTATNKLGSQYHSLAVFATTP